jgi:hypothetical protein
MTGYLVRDYAALRRVLLDQLAADLPGWRDPNPADVGVALAELFAYLGDHLSYAQDAAATEAYLGTARFRQSVRRHARLLDYAVHDGCCARTWLVVRGEAELPAGTEVTTPRGECVFHTLHPLTVRRSRDAVPTAADLPAGVTRARLVADGDLGLRAGDVIAFEDTAGGPPCVVRLDADPVPTGAGETVVTWHPQDAPRGPLSAPVARGNVVLAEHGRLVAAETLLPPVVTAVGRHRPRLARPGLAFAQPYDHGSATAAAAADALATDPTRAVPAIVALDDEVTAWQARSDLLGSGDADAHYVVETEEDGTARLRFGDGVHGRAPVPGTVPRAAYRIGGGPGGNVGRAVLTRFVDARPGVEVYNCVPAAGGVAAQSTEQARLLAPHGARRVERAVTEADHSTIAARHPLVDRAWSVRRWTGAWYTVTTVVDPPAGVDLGPGELALVTDHLRRHGMAGQDVRVVPAVPVPLDIRLTVRVRPGHAPAQVADALRDAFSAGTRRDGGRGYFHPDNFSLAQPVHLSDVVATAMAVPGVWWLDTSENPVLGNRFHRWGRPQAGELAAGRIAVGDHEVVRCASDPDRPGSGMVGFTVEEDA